MKTQTKRILEILSVVTWIAAIGFAIECGSQIVSLVVSFNNPEKAGRIYGANPDFFTFRQYNSSYFICAITLKISVTALKSYIWFKVIDLISKLNLDSPFTTIVAKKLEKISYILLEIAILCIIGKGYMDYISKNISMNISGDFRPQEYLFMAGIVYIISQIFKRGVEIQAENELTV